jgi:hypothetical protein
MLVQAAPEVNWMGGDRAVELYVAADAEEAHLVSMVLSEAGIKAGVVGEAAQSVLGVWPGLFGVEDRPRVWVSEKDQTRARTIIAEWEKQRRADRTGSSTSWECAQCGAEVDADFDICWKCQSPKGAP